MKSKAAMALAGWAALALALPMAQGSASASSRMVTVGAAAHVSVAAHDVGPLSSATPVTVDVVLKPRDPAALAAEVAAVSDPGSPQYHHFLATGQFAALFGPLPSTVAAVRTSLAGEGLAPEPASSNGLVVQVRASAAAASAAFHTRLEAFHVAGRSAYANLDAPQVPASVAADVQAVTGLDTVDTPHPQDLHIHASAGSASSATASGSSATATASSAASSAARVVSHATGPVPCSTATQLAQQQGAWTGDQIATAYGFTSAYAAGHLGSGQTIALYEEEPYSQSDVSTFEQCYGISTAVSPINVDNGPTPGPGSGESILDIDNIVDLAPASSIAVYQGPPGSGTDIWNKIVTDNTAKVISTSWGICEPLLATGQAQAEATIFQQAAAQGQSILDASGDAGSSDCYSPNNGSTDTELAVDDPGGQPYITAVGGTSLTSIAPVTEKVWNNCLGQPSTCSTGPGGAGGGGLSKIWTMPSWQKGPGVNNQYTPTTACPTSAGSGSPGSCREVPDVAALADPSDGYVVFCSCNPGNGWGAAGGTSAAAPVWAALVALANEACGSSSGFLNPTVYNIGTNAATDFHDITSGNNDLIGNHSGAYPATTGFDLATGWGTPTSALLQPGALCGGAVQPPTTGYWMLGSAGHVYNFGNATALGSPSATGIYVGLATTPTGKGYWVTDSAGNVSNFGDAPALSPSSLPSGGTVVTIAATPDGKGYWLASDRGQVVTAGDAQSFGDLSSKNLNSSIVDMATTPTGKGYWLLGGDGGVFTFGDAGFFGSTGNKQLNKPAVAMAPTSDAQGYWFVASDGGMFAFGDAAYYGSVYQLNPGLPAGGSNGIAPINQPANGIVVTPDGKGYWMVAADGGVFTFGDAGFVGSLGGQSIPAPIVAFAPD